MSALIQSIEHGLAVAASDIVKVARFIQSKVLPELKVAQASETVIEKVTGLVSPQAVSIERVGFALLGLAIKTIEDTSATAITTGLNGTVHLPLSAELVADLKAIAATVKAAAK